MCIFRRDLVKVSQEGLATVEEDSNPTLQGYDQSVKHEHRPTNQLWLPLRILRRSPSSFHRDKPESTDDVTNEVFEKALTCKRMNSTYNLNNQQNSITQHKTIREMNHSVLSKGARWCSG